MATKTNPDRAPLGRDALLSLLEDKVERLADKYTRQHDQLVKLRQERTQLLQGQEKLQEQIRHLQQKLSARGDSTVIAPVQELYREVNEMINIVDECLQTLEKGIR